MRRFHPVLTRSATLLGKRELVSPIDLRSALLVAGMTLCWLTPNHFMPWLSFDADFGMTVVLLAACTACVGSPGHWRVGGLALGAAAAASIPFVQLGAGLIYFSGDAWMFGGGLFGVALAIGLGSTLEARHRGAVAGSVLVAAFCASVLSVGIQAWQWLRLDVPADLPELEWWLLSLPPGARPFANLGQPNQLSTLLLWGLAGTWWIYSRRRIGGVAAAFAAAYLLFGLAMTQSRSGWIGLAMMAVMAWTYRRPLDSARYRVALAALLAYFVLLTVAWSSINEALHLSAAESMENRLSAGARVLNWKACLAAIAQRPWFGFGWGQVAVAQQSAVLVHPASGEYFAYAHNLILDLLLWNGVPLGGLLAASFAIWVLDRFRRVASADAAILSMAVCAFLVHALLEYPHAYLYLLLPASLMLGSLSVSTFDRAPAVLMPRAVIALAIAAAAALSAWVLHDYAEAARNMEQLRFESARIGTSRHSDPPDIALLTQLREYLATSRIDVHQPVDEATLDRLRKVAERYASDSSVFRYAMSAAISGRPDLAVVTLQKICRIHSKENCHSVRTAWMAEALGRHPEMKAVLEEMDRRSGAKSGRD